MFYNTPFEEIIEFDSNFIQMEDMMTQSPQAILMHALLEDRGMIDYEIMEAFKTRNYAIFCNN